MNKQEEDDPPDSGGAASSGIHTASAAAAAPLPGDGRGVILLEKRDEEDEGEDDETFFSLIESMRESAYEEVTYLDGNQISDEVCLAVPPGGGTHTAGGLLRLSAAPPCSQPLSAGSELRCSWPTARRSRPTDTEEIIHSKITPELKVTLRVWSHGSRT